MSPHTTPRSHGDDAVVGKRLGEAHADPGPDRGGHADEEGLPILMSREGGGEERRQCRDGSVDQAG
jgi:hypothetical protein